MTKHTKEINQLIDGTINKIVELCELENSFHELDYVIEDLVMDLMQE